MRGKALICNREEAGSTPALGSFVRLVAVNETRLLCRECNAPIFARQPDFDFRRSKVFLLLVAGQ